MTNEKRHGTLKKIHEHKADENKYHKNAKLRMYVRQKSGLVHYILKMQINHFVP